jgi:hypothetical protein
LGQENCLAHHFVDFYHFEAVIVVVLNQNYVSLEVLKFFDI